MLDNAPFYRNQLKRYAVAFMSLFDDIWIQKFAAGATTPTETLKVPISYGPKEKWLARLKNDPDLARPTGISLPQMAALITGVNYATDRKLQSTNRFVSTGSTSGDTSSRNFTYTPVPIDIMWQLNVMTQATDDAHQIVEQIIPFFTPEWTCRIQLVDEIGMDVNIPILFTVASSTDTYDADFKERRVLIWTLDFIMKAYFFGPTRNGSIIKLATADLYVNLDANTWSFQSNVSPGMLANGSPTSNAQLSVPANTINANDNWGYVVQTTDNSDK